MLSKKNKQIRGNARTHLIGKLVIDFLFVIIELLRCYKQKSA